MSGLFFRRRPRRGRSGLAGLLGAALLAPSLALAQCAGQDLRQSADPALWAEVEAEMAAMPYARGLSWRATRGDRELRLIGTLHLNDPRHAPIVAALAPEIRAADALLVEINRQDKARADRQLLAQPELIYITEGPTLIDRLPDPAWQQVARLAQAAGIPPFAAAKMRPWFLSMSLSVPLCARRIPDVAHGLDQQLMVLAEEAGVAVRSLEEAMTVFQALNADPLDKQVADLSSYIALMGVEEDEFHTMLESYFDGAFEAFNLLQTKAFLRAEMEVPVAERQRQLDEVLEALLYQRNRDWVPVIEAQAGDRLVVAVGAAHLPGERGLLALLAAEGYVITEAPL